MNTNSAAANTPALSPSASEPLRRRAALAVTVVAVLLLLSACHIERGSGNIVTETVSVADFTEVEISDSLDAIITVGPATSVQVTTDDNIVDNVRIRLDGDRLKVDMDNGMYWGDDAVVTITTPTLDRLIANGSTDVDVTGVDAEFLDVTVNGSSNVNLGDVQLAELVMDVHGSSDVSALGTAAVVYLDVHGSSDVDMDSMRIDRADVDVAGSSSVDVRTAMQVRGSLHGASSVDVSRDAVVDVDTNGSSDIDWH